MPPLVLGPARVVWVSVGLQCTATLYSQPEEFSHFIAFQSIEFSVDSGSDGLITNNSCIRICLHFLSYMTTPVKLIVQKLHNCECMTLAHDIRTLYSDLLLTAPVYGWRWKLRYQLVLAKISALYRSLKSAARAAGDRSVYNKILNLR